MSIEHYLYRDARQADRSPTFRAGGLADTIKNLTLGLVVACASGAAGFAGATETNESPFAIRGGTPIDCSATPFGRRLPIGIDQEVVLTVQDDSGISQNFQLSGDLALERSNSLDGVLVNAVDLASAPADLNGDGLEELVVVGANADGTLGVRVVRQDSENVSSNEQFGAYEWTTVSPATFVIDLEVAAADLDGSTDGKEEVVIAIRYNQNVLRVIALSGDADGNILQSSDTALATWVLPSGTTFGENSYMRMATGDALLEGRDQVILYYDGATTVLRAAGTAEGATPSMTFADQTFGSAETPNDPENVKFHLANFGGSAASELLIHEQRFVNGSWESIRQRVRYLTTQRDETTNEITSFTLEAGTNTNFIGDSNFEFYAVAVGEMDRRPGDEFVVARQLNGTNELEVEMYRVSFDAMGRPDAVGPASPEVVATTLDLRRSFVPLDVALGDAEGDAIGDVYVTARDRLPNNQFIPRVFKFAMTRPADPNEFPDVGTFSQVGSFDLPEVFGDRPLRINQVRVADWDNDSVLGDLGSSCARIREPLIRTVVNLPPYWDRLQQTTPGSGFNASIGQTRSAGSTEATQYDTFTASDISGYVGVSAGGNVFGIGVKTTVKATAGRNDQVANGEIFSTTITSTATQTQSQTAGEGLLVLESNTFDCYAYDVIQNGAAAQESSLRVCELIRRSGNGDELRSFEASDLETWDTVIAAGTGAGTPAQWAPLHADWSSLALFRPATTNITPANATTAELAFDGLFDTSIESDPESQPYVEVDLGEVRDITNIRVFPSAGEAQALVGFELYASATAFVGDGLPSGPGVRTYSPDPRSSNGVDRWNIRTRGDGPGFQPLEARYVRLQHPGSASLAVAEIQVFGDVHLEPPSYPQSVCDPVANDGFFLARVVDTVAVTPVYRNVQVRGDLAWTGAPTDAGCGPNFGGLPGGTVNDSFGRIWSNLIVGATGIDSWDLTESGESAYGTSNSITHSSRVGAEVEINVGPVVAGSAYSFETGVSREDSSTIFWGEGLQYSGAVPGFLESAPGCAYRPQPYSYVTSERSNVGYTHRYTVVDYVVRDLTWSRLGPNFPPTDCFVRAEGIFADSFEVTN